MVAIIRSIAMFHPLSNRNDESEGLPGTLAMEDLFDDESQIGHWTL